MTDSAFSEERVGNVVEPCRQQKTKVKSKPWDVDCVKKILCKNDSALVTQLSKTSVTTADDIFFDDPYFDGKKWTTKRFPAGGTADPQSKSILILAGSSCESAATTFYHEVWHQNQPLGMGWPEPAEDDAYANTEQWTIDRGLPTQHQGIRKKDPKSGKSSPDLKAIRAFVQKEYPGPPPPVAGVPQPVPVNSDKKKKLTQVRDPKTGTTSWRPSKAGDTYAGPQQLVNEKTVDATQWKCS
jgi:hypothetical protein